MPEPIYCNRSDGRLGVPFVPITPRSDSLTLGKREKYRIIILEREAETMLIVTGSPLRGYADRRVANMSMGDGEPIG